jgi:hypothetical protein
MGVTPRRIAHPTMAMQKTLATGTPRVWYLSLYVEMSSTNTHAEKLV